MKTKQNIESIVAEFKRLKEEHFSKNSTTKEQEANIKKYNKLYMQIVKLSMTEKQRKIVRKIKVRNQLKNIALFPTILVECLMAVPVKILVLCTSWPVAVVKAVQKEKTQLTGEKGFLPWMQEISFRTTTPLSLKLIYSTEMDKENLEEIYRDVVNDTVKNSSPQDKAQLESVTIENLDTTEKISSQPIKSYESTKVNSVEKEIQK